MEGTCVRCSKREREAGLSLCSGLQSVQHVCCCLVKKQVLLFAVINFGIIICIGGVRFFRNIPYVVFIIIIC